VEPLLFVRLFVVSIELMEIDLILLLNN